MSIQQLFQTKPPEQILSEAEGHHSGGLKRVLGPVDLTAIGIGAIIGAGIFVITGATAATQAGPGIMLSFVVAGIACILSAMCYAEFAARLPIAGSAYTYAYASVGELMAWIIGWDLILEYTIASATVAVGWGEYVAALLKGYGLTLPQWLLGIPVGSITIHPLPGMLVAVLSILLALGIKESARFNSLMVVVKLAVIVLVILAGIPWVRPENWSPFLPFGIPGIFKGAALIFFAYIGFDAVSTAAEEVRNPQRDLPIGIIASLVVCTVLYIAVAAVITGMVPYQQIDHGAPLATAFADKGVMWATQLISLGGVVGLTTVVLILLMSQPRIFFSMARDGLIPSWMAQINPKFRTPINATVVTGLLSATMAMVVPMEDLHMLVSIGTLFAFFLVSACVLILRYREPERPFRSINLVSLATVGLVFFGLYFNHTWPIMAVYIGSFIVLWAGFRLLGIHPAKPHQTFNCPGLPWLPLIGMGFNLYLMLTLPPSSWERLAIWMALGLIFYALYGFRKSKLGKQLNQP